MTRSRQVILALVWVLGCICGAALFSSISTQCQASEITLDRLFAAIRQVESGGDNYAVGDSGRSRGPFQIQRAYWNEAVKGTDAASWDYLTYVWDPDRAAYVVWLHWEKVCPGALRKWNVESLVRHHRLPYAPWRSDNDKYWAKVQNALNTE